MLQAEKPLAAALFAAMMSIPAAAQLGSNSAPGLNTAFTAAQTAVSPAQTQNIGKAQPMTGGQTQATSCADAKELEIPFVLSFAETAIRPVPLHFAYDGCDTMPRNDYQPPYTERSYKGEYGYTLKIVTDEGGVSSVMTMGTSEVTLFKGESLVSNFGKLPAALTMIPTKS